MKKTTKRKQEIKSLTLWDFCDMYNMSVPSALYILRKSGTQDGFCRWLYEPHVQNAFATPGFRPCPVGAKVSEDGKTIGFPTSAIRDCIDQTLQTDTVYWAMLRAGIRHIKEANGARIYWLIPFEPIYVLRVCCWLKWFAKTSRTSLSVPLDSLARDETVQQWALNMLLCTGDREQVSALNAECKIWQEYFRRIRAGHAVDWDNYKLKPAERPVPGEKKADKTQDDFLKDILKFCEGKTKGDTKVKADKQLRLDLPDPEAEPAQPATTKGETGEARTRVILLPSKPKESDIEVNITIKASDKVHKEISDMVKTFADFVVKMGQS